MKRRLLCLGLLAVSQVFATGCIFHPIARWRANHPCGPYSHIGHHHHGPRHAVVGEPVCHGCASPGVPVVVGTGHGDLIPITNPPGIGQPYPLTPGPKVVPSYELPNPMPVKPPGDKN
ncbi:MAG: hypothetical protein FJ304_23160 [Planctomycetes bacterium]|nr:hypothetical protein [Planctomycetota bacterium]